MPSLLDNFDPEILSLIQGQGGGGLLGGAAKPRAPEGLLDQVFGTGPDDPRSQAMSAFSQGLLRGDVAAAFGGANNAFEVARDRAERQRLGQIGMLKTGLELQGMFDSTKRAKGIRADLDKFNQGQQPQAPAFSFNPQANPYGIPDMGGLPMFSQGAQSLPRLGAPQLPGQPLAPVGGGMQAQGAGLTDNLTQRLLQEAQIYAKWGEHQMADKLYERAAKFLPEVKEIGTAMQDGKPVQVITYKDGRQQVSTFGPAPKTHWLDTGDSIQAIDETSMQPRGGPFRKGMTPSDKIAAGNLEVTRARFALDRDAPQYVQTDGGYIALPKRPGAGPIVGRPVTGEDGQPIRQPLKPIPPSANTAILSNMQNLERARSALALLEGGEVGQAKGDPAATGWKGYLPNAMLNRVDPSGTDTRAAIADLGSLVIHDRSGAAVTAAESPRLMPFIPLTTDDAPTAAKKLRRFMDIYQQETNALGEMYGEAQGYKPSPMLTRKQAGAQPEQVQARPLPPNPTAASLQTGQAYKLPNGVTAVWDGLQFKARK